MPTYLFECEKGHVTENVYPVEECPRTVVCPKCARSAKKTIAPVGFCLSTVAEARDHDTQAAYARQRRRNELHVAKGGEVHIDTARDHSSNPTAPTLAGIAAAKEHLRRTAGK